LAEGAFGLLLLAAPGIIIKLLFNLDVDGAAAITSRLTGLAILSLAVACWPEEGAVRPYYGMLTWSVLAAVGLVAIGIAGHAGILLWPGVAVHGMLSVAFLWLRGSKS
jgi:hypothetical protein